MATHPVKRARIATAIAVVLLSTCSPFALLSQEDDIPDFQLWLDYVMWVPTGGDVSFGGDVGARGFLSNYDWNQLYVRPAIRYRFNESLVGAAGVSYWRTNNADVGNVNELRFHQDLEIPRWPSLGPVRLYFRLRFEERFLFYKDIPDQWYVRARFMTGLSTTDFSVGDQKLFVMALWELFSPIINSSAQELFIDRQRYKIILGHKFATSWRYELHFLLQKSRVYSDDGFSRDTKILRIRFFHNMQLNDL